MPRVELGTTLPVSVEAGFAYITDPRNWHAFWPGYVRLHEGWSWAEPGDVTVLVVRFLGRERDLLMTLRRFEPNSLVAYETRQRGLPDAWHERRFAPDESGLLYTLAVEFEPRRGVAGVVDRTLLQAGIRRAMRNTFRALEPIVQTLPDAQRDAARRPPTA